MTRFTYEDDICRLCTRVQSYLGRDFGHSGIVAEEPALIVTDIGGIMALVKRSRMVDNTGDVPVYTV